MIDVSICVITFNHEKYIISAIDSFLMQNTKYEYEIVIGEDFSTDCTRQICENYLPVFSEKVVILPTSENYGMIKNFLRTINACRGRYIAICEGDDYWTDPFKLQKQVDFLEANPEYGMVSSDINLIDENGNPLPDNKMILKQRLNFKQTIDFFDLLESNQVNTLTVCVRNNLMKELASRVIKENLLFVYDWWFWLNISLKSKIRVFDEKMANYRVHSNGISQGSYLRSRSPLAFRDAYLSFYKVNRNLPLQKNQIKILNKRFYKLFKNERVSLNIRLWALYKLINLRLSLLKVQFRLIYGMKNRFAKNQAWTI